VFDQHVTVHGLQVVGVHVTHRANQDLEPVFDRLLNELFGRLGTVCSHHDLIWKKDVVDVGAVFFTNIYFKNNAVYNCS
jgi:hypothetical protein